MLLVTLIKICSLTSISFRPNNTDKKRRETPDGETKTPIFRNKADGRMGYKGGNVILVEGIIIAVAMAMYVGAEWTAEDVIDK